MHATTSGVEPAWFRLAASPIILGTLVVLTWRLRTLSWLRSSRMTLQPLVRSLKVEGVGTPGQHYARSSFFAVGFFVVAAFIFAVIIHALGVGLNCPGGPPGGSLAVAAVEGHRRCHVVLRVAGACRDDLWPFLVEMVATTATACSTSVSSSWLLAQPHVRQTAR